MFILNCNYSIELFSNNVYLYPDNITVVSGYWNIKNKYGDNKYDEWFKNTLNINQRYVFFCDTSNVEYIKSFRPNYETIFVDYPLDMFYTNQFSKDNWIESTHVPSKELGMIWNEKINLLKIAKDQDNSPTEFYVWIDAGVAPYRDLSPPDDRLNIKDVNSLPKNKLCYSGVNEDYHNFSGTVLIIHRDFIDTFHNKYYNMLSICDDGWKCGSDQYIFTKLLKTEPEMFHKISEGYGQNLVELYDKYV